MVAVTLAAAGVFGVLMAIGILQTRSEDHRALVRFYCQTGAYSTAQEQACQRHVAAAHVDRRANHGDLAAIKAEHELQAYQDASERQ